MARGEDKLKSTDELARALDIELAQKRAGWQRDREKYRTIRAASFVFLFLVILGALFVFYLCLGRVNQARTSQPAPTPASSPR
jgi:hypothetical protein